MKNDEIKLCYKDACIQAEDRNAKTIVFAITLLLLASATAVIIKAIK